MQRFPIAWLAVALAILAGAAGAAAEPPAPPARPDTAVYQIPELTVQATRARTTTGGASAVVVTLDSTAARPAPTLEQILRSLPLVVVRTNSRGEAQPALRGGEDRQIAVLVDGVPITLAWDHRTDLAVIPLTAARSLTLHRGFSSLLYGPNALAGAVEVSVSSGAQADVAPPPLQLDLGVDATGARSAALTAGRLRSAGGGRWLARAGGGYRGADGFALPGALRDAEPATRARLTADGDTRLNTDHQAFDGFLSLRRVTAGGAWASFTGAGYRLERGIAPEVHTAEPRLWRYPFQARGLGALSAGTGMRATPWGRGDLEASLGVDVSRTEIDEYDGLEYRTVVGDERDDDRTLTARLLGDHTLGRAGDLRLAATLADVRHDEVLSGDPRARYRQRLWSVASETDWRIPAAVPVRIGVGAAADGSDTPLSADKPALGRLWDWAARVGATASLRNGTFLVHTSSGRRARFPSLRELYSGALGRFLENPDLAAEVQWTAELGGTWRHARGEFQMVGYTQRLDQAITRVTVSTPSGNKFQRVNLGRTTARGFEALGRVTLGTVVVGAHATLQRARARTAAGAETELEYEPEVQGGLWGAVPLPGRLELGADLNGAGAQQFIDLDRGTFARLAPGLRIDLRLSRGFTLGAAGPFHRLETALAFENLADQPIFDQAGLPQPGRTIRIQARLH